MLEECKTCRFSGEGKRECAAARDGYCGLFYRKEKTKEMENKDMNEKKTEEKIVITRKGIKSIGMDDDTVLASLASALVSVYNDTYGPIDEVHAGKAIIDTLISERTDMRINMIWEAVMDDDEDFDEDEDDDEYEEDD